MDEDFGELMSLEYNPEREREELMKQAESGRKYKAASEVLNEIMSIQRDNIIRQLESTEFENDGDALGLVLYLRVLKICNNLISTKIDEGRLAEEELNKYGDDD